MFRGIVEIDSCHTILITNARLELLSLRMKGYLFARGTGLLAGLCPPPRNLVSNSP